MGALDKKLDEDERKFRPINNDEYGLYTMAKIMNPIIATWIVLILIVWFIYWLIM